LPGATTSTLGKLASGVMPSKSFSANARQVAGVAGQGALGAPARG
jgi:hypothetical protein